MTHLLDTNICIYLIKRKPAEVFQRFRQQAPGTVGVSSVTAGELWYGVFKSQSVTRNRAALEQFLLPLVIAEFTAEACLVYGEVRAALERVGTPIGPLDTMIAAHALQLGATLVTNNLREFERVPGLRTENWILNTS